MVCGARVRSDALTEVRFVELRIPLVNFDHEKAPKIKRKKVG